ncbi:ribosomal protein S6 kinase 2 beta-like [Aquarana catesbeiana]|uniref:ribosomal protein S6 kinase 2 beta-like n=1 Tax=Aquarana catesbeiana TaxID=8400 RepID=UPI003CC9A2F7
MEIPSGMRFDYVEAPAGGDTMASNAHDVIRVLDRMVSFHSQRLHQVDIREHFIIVKELGEGGFGKVFLANHRKTGRRMALKVMAKSRTSRESFLREFTISFLLSSHPNIIGCCEIIFTTFNCFVFAQELAPLGDLLSLIVPNVGIPEDVVKRCAVQISNALQFIVEKGLVHLDVKPDNVLVFDQECHSIKLTDFGLAKVTGTVIRSKCGSKPYRAPEMYEITPPDGLAVDGSLDVWAFGVTIYVLLTGKFPWQDTLPDDEEFKSFVVWQKNFEVDNPPEAWREVSTGILRMFFDLLAIDSTKRSQSAEVLKYMGEIWKAETPKKDEEPIENSSFKHSDKSLCEASYLNSSKSDVSITSTLSSTSSPLIIDTSGSQSEMTSEPQKDNMEEALIIYDEEFSMHVGAEDTMASVAHEVEALLDGMISFYAQRLRQVDVQKYFLLGKELGKGQTVALKFMDRSRNSQESFLREFSVSSFLSSHPNIIGCCDFICKTTYNFVFAQELAPVGDLFSLIIPHVGIPEDAVKRCAVQISNALEFMAEKGLVHMDLKPENILVFDKECHCIKITDFGLAKVGGTVITSRCGSQSYMAPEMRAVTIAGGLTVDGSLDVWAFGIIIYCLLTGEFPWRVAILDDKGYKCFVQWQNNFKMDDPPEAWRKVPTKIRRMFSGLLAIDYSKRSQSTEVLKFTSQSWKEETVDSATREEGEDPTENNSSAQSEDLSASHLYTSQSSRVSITSNLSSMSSSPLTTNTSLSQSEMSPEAQEDNMEEALMMFDDEFSLHIGAEVDVG